MEGTVLAGAYRANEAVGLFKQDSMLLVVDRTRPVLENCPFSLREMPGIEQKALLMLL